MALVSYELEDGIAVLTLSRPEKRNAMSDAMLNDLGAAVDRAAKEAKAAVLAAKGDHFCAGLDLKEQVEKSVMEGIAGSRSWHAVFSRIQRGAIPYFAALHGAVVGGGLELAAAAHVRVADANTHFALPEAQRGIFVGGGGSVNVARLMGVARMVDMMLTGRVLSAEEAERYGVVNYVTESGGARAKAMELARIAACNAPLSNYAVINALPRIHDSGYDEGLFFESMIATLTQVTPDAQERLRAFLDKKAPRLAIPAERGGGA
ncbi:crotonase/enoyl-CoA hydratase family protein [Chelativorans sp. SCAU2101]|jgi:Enoyl-CoA hydratase/carnithine racemase|uniref:Crotonase/enoyl-CoA hydratase family protein n=1 Tax=Chelativorans petroleitrophicus TaxID=2975484 RepID=A0A9X2X8S8_9HYPH|nr:crotonase/enoyl-CoA hydratase family protein [Chelativorans petroleitrophicus]MCT8990534.1 crotonase/enoyl-CoA hydratase family protein [Chelativorans petroleitrophicus]